MEYKEQFLRGLFETLVKEAVGPVSRHSYSGRRIPLNPSDFPPPEHPLAKSQRNWSYGGYTPAQISGMHHKKFKDLGIPASALKRLTLNPDGSMPKDWADFTKNWGSGRR